MFTPCQHGRSTEHYGRMADSDTLRELLAYFHIEQFDLNALESLRPTIETSELIDTCDAGDAAACDEVAMRYVTQEALVPDQTPQRRDPESRLQAAAL